MEDNKVIQHPNKPKFNGRRRYQGDRGRPTSAEVVARPPETLVTPQPILPERGQTMQSEEKAFIQVGRKFLHKKNIAYIRFKSKFENIDQKDSVVVYFIGHSSLLEYVELIDELEVKAVEKYLLGVAVNTGG